MSQRFHAHSFRGRMELVQRCGGGGGIRNAVRICTEGPPNAFLVLGGGFLQVYVLRYGTLATRDRRALEVLHEKA